MATITTSKRFTLNWNDLWKGLKMAVILPVLTAAYQSIEDGSFIFDWKLLGKMAIGGLIGYLIKNFIAPADIVVTGVKSDTINAIQDGTADVKVVTK